MRYVDRSKQAKRKLLEAKAPLAVRMAETVRDEIVHIMETSTPTGESKGGHTRSAPGEPPAEETGDYIASWKVTPAEISTRRVTASAYTSLKSGDGQALRGGYLEYGTEHMEPRPHVRPAIYNVQPAIQELARKASS